MKNSKDLNPFEYFNRFQDNYTNEYMLDDYQANEVEFAPGTVVRVCFWRQRAYTYAGSFVSDLSTSLCTR